MSVTELFAAARDGDFSAFVNGIQRNPANINAIEPVTGATLLTAALSKYNEEIAACIIRDKNFTAYSARVKPSSDDADDGSKFIINAAFAAVWSGASAEIVSQIFSKSTPEDLNVADDSGTTLLMHSVRGSNYGSLASDYITKGVFKNINAVNASNESALYFACSNPGNNAYYDAKALIGAGADVNIVSTARERNTVLHAAAHSGSFDLLELILSSSPSITKATVEAVDVNGDTALGVALGNIINGAALRAFLSHGIDKLHKNKCEQNYLHCLAKSSSISESYAETLMKEWGIDENETDEDGNTPLFLAVTSENESLVSYFLRQGCDPAHTNDEGLTAFQVCAARSGRNGGGDVMRILVKRHNCEENGNADCDCFLGGFLKACEQCNLEVIEKMEEFDDGDFVGMIKRKVASDPKMASNGGLLRRLAEGGSTAIVDYIDRNQIPIDYTFKFKNDKTAIHIWAEADNNFGDDDDFIEALQKKGVDVNAQTTPLGTTAMMLAATVDDGNRVAALIRRGASVEAVDKKGHTALYYAADVDSPAAAYQLVDLGKANPRRAGAAGSQTPYDCAVENESDKVLEVFKELNQ